MGRHKHLIPEDAKHTVLAVAGCNGFPVDGVFVALCFPGGERYWKQSDGDVLQVT